MALEKNETGLVLKDKTNPAYHINSVPISCFVVCVCVVHFTNLYYPNPIHVHFVHRPIKLQKIRCNMMEISQSFRFETHCHLSMVITIRKMNYLLVASHIDFIFFLTTNIKANKQTNKQANKQT